MSSTRGLPRLGGPEDFFRTPSWTVRRLLEAVTLPGGWWLEPGAGDGSIIRAVNAERRDVRWIASEVRPVEHEGLRRHAELVVGDLLTPISRGALERLHWTGEITVVAGNPAFNIAEDVVLRCREMFPNATIVLQLRLNFVGSGGRSSWMRRMPPDIYLIPERVSYALGETDSIEYAWLLWPPGERPRGSFQVLASTSLEERKRDAPVIDLCLPCMGHGFFDGAGRPVPKKAKCDKQPCVECFGRGKVTIAWAVPPRPRREIQGVP